MTQRFQLQKTRLIIAFGVAALLAAVIGSLLAASPASAQLPDICAQYPDDDICVGPGDEASPEGDQGPGDDGGDRDGSGDGDGSLPFTGYPLTTLILLLLLLLALGLLARGVAAVRERLGRDSAL